jgi:hypothetical protein
VTNLNEFAGLGMDILLQPEKILENSGMFCALWNIVIKKMSVRKHDVFY